MNRDQSAEPAVEPSLNLEDDQAFLESWRKELLARAWANLERDQAVSGQQSYTVLRFRSDNPTGALAPSGRGASPAQLQTACVTGRRRLAKCCTGRAEKFADILVWRGRPLAEKCDSRANSPRS